jgi:arginine N-succinyltransferase
VREHNGPAEIGSLFLSPEYRGRDAGRLLQLSRFLFVAEHPDAFEPQVVSELRGVIDAAGRSASGTRSAGTSSTSSSARPIT